MLHDVMAAALPLVGLVLAYVFRTGIAALQASNKLKLTEQQRALLVGAGDRAGGIMYDFMASRAAGMDPETARQEAFQAGLAYLRQPAVAHAITELGVPEAAVHDLLRGQFGKLLAADPTVTVVNKLNPPA